MAGVVKVSASQPQGPRFALPKMHYLFWLSFADSTLFGSVAKQLRRTGGPNLAPKSDRSLLTLSYTREKGYKVPVLILTLKQ